MSEIKSSHELWFVKARDYKGLRETFDALDGEIDKLEAENAALKETQRWIPVSERLPETYKPVLTVDMSEATQVPVPAFYNPDTECWSTHFKYDLWVTHWMPLPELPEADK